MSAIYIKSNILFVVVVVVVIVVVIIVIIILERFSFKCRKVIGFAVTTLRDWLEKLAPLFHPIRSKTKTNHKSLALIFPRFASATCNYFEFDWFTVLSVSFLIG